jgi:hypothetical protein
MLRRVALVRTDVTEELSASIFRVTRIGEAGTTLAVTSNLRTLRRNTIVSLTDMDQAVSTTPGQCLFLATEMTFEIFLSGRYKQI